MSFLKKITGFLTGGFLQSAGDLVDKFVTTKGEKEALKQAMQALIQQHESRLLALANEDRKNARHMQEVALQQNDTFSKRFVYYLAGLWSAAGIAYVFMVTFSQAANTRVADTVLGFLMGTIVST